MDLQGTDGANALTGGAGDDVIYGFGGNDTLKGGAGDDVLAGHSGNDLLQGGDGEDYLLGGSGNDTLDGGAGGDWAAYEDATAAVKVDLNNTNAQNTGGGGTDKLTGIEHVYGSAFNDVLIGNADNNMMVGDAGNDSLTGGKGDDTLWGSVGADTVDGGDGDDYLVGGAGDDVVRGGAGWDWSSYEDATAGVTVDLNKTATQDTGGAGKDTLSGIEHLYGTKFNDTLTGDAKDNYLWGADGDDKLYGGAGNDHLSGGAGNNIISGGDGWDTVDYAFSTTGVRIDLHDTVPPLGGSPQVGDYIYSIEAAMGSAYDDAIFGNSAENYLFGDAGNDDIYAKGGHDVVDGGDGDDRLVTSLNGSGDLLLGGAGADDFWINPGTSAATLEGGEGSDTLHVSVGAGDVTFDLRITGVQAFGVGRTIAASGIENVSVGTGNDKLTGDVKDNVLQGGAGNDTLDGGAGSDTVSYDDGFADTVVIDLGKQVQVANSGHGTDTLISIENVIGSSVYDYITGNAAANHLEGRAGDDWLAAVGGNDLLEGGAGDDVLIATREGASNDKLFGGAGNDRLVTNRSAATLDGGDGDDVFDVPHVMNMAGTIVINGGAGVDTLDMSSYYDTLVNLKIDLSVSGRQDVGGGQFLDLKSVENVFGFGGNDLLKGNAENNLLRGGMGNDTLDGGAGLDIASYDEPGFTTGVSVDLRNSVQTNLGGRGTDTLISIEGVHGTAYNDTLIGDANDNVFIGGKGDDYIDGGAGFDYVSFDNDGVTEGAGVSLWLTWQNTINPRGLDTLISIEGVIGSKYNDSFSGSTGNNILLGRDGNDSLSGYGGADTLDGGAGDDYLSAYVWQDNSLSSTGTRMLGGEGRDTIELGRGDNYVEGGAGDDHFYFGNMPGHKVVDGGAGYDTIQFEYRLGDGIEFTSGISVDLSKTGVQQIATGVTATISSIERAYGTQGADLIIGNDSDNYLDGFQGDDVIWGGGGNDTLSGREGADVLTGGKGADSLWGGDGSDTFVFAVGDSVPADAITGAGIDVIMDFQSSDEIRFTGKSLPISFGSYTATDFASALATANTLLKAAAYNQLYMAFQVGSDVYIFAGQNTVANAPGIENIIKLQGVSAGAVSIDNFF